MKYIYIALIKFYQRFISPYKGFHCAHHVLHGEQTCSNAVKSLVLENGFFKALPLIRQRFDDCHSAYNSLQTDSVGPYKADLPCAVPCDIGLGDCGGGTSTGSDGGCIWVCDWPFSLSKKWQKYLLIGFVTLCIGLLYVGYGRQIGVVYLTDLGQSEQGLVARLIQRDQPEVRVLIVVDGKKHYSNIVHLNEVGVETKFVLESSISDFDFDYLEVLDARLNVADKLVVIGQVLEKFEYSQQQAKKQAQGERFRYRLKRRWHF